MAFLSTRGLPGAGNGSTMALHVISSSMKLRFRFAVVAFCFGLMIARYGRAQSPLQRVPVDSSFPAAADGEISAILVQSDSRIVIGGSFTNVNGAKRPGIARLQP